MKTFTITPDAARAIVKSGFPKVTKRIQTIKAPPPAVEEAPFAQFKVSGAWTSSASGYRASAYMLDGNGEVCSGTMTVYAPFATTETAKDLPKGKIHAARVEGRWELIQGGGGGSSDDSSKTYIFNGIGIGINKTEVSDGNSYTIYNTGITELGVCYGTITGRKFQGTLTPMHNDPRTASFHNGLYFDNAWFDYGWKYDNDPNVCVSPKWKKIRGELYLFARANGDTVTFGIGRREIE